MCSSHVQAGIIEEMLDETMSDVMDDTEEMEEEAQEEIDKVIWLFFGFKQCLGLFLHIKLLFYVCRFCGS